MKTRLFLQLPGLALTALLTLLVGQGLAFGHEDGDKSVLQRTALRKHPQVGAWLILNAPSGPSTVVFSADGTVVFGTQATQGLPGGVGCSSVQSSGPGARRQPAGSLHRRHVPF